jgi:HlyD family secretion protein
MKKRVVILIVVIALAATAALAVLRPWRSKEKNTIKLSGNIELTEVSIAFKGSGKLVQLLVKEGDTVRKGQEIARLDRDQLVLTLDREQASLAAAQSQVAQLETAIRYQQEQIAGDLEQREAQLNESEAHLDELETGSRPQEVEQARAAVNAARTEHDRARKDWERAQALFKNDDISAQQHDQFRSRFETSRSALSEAEQRLALVQEGPRKETISAAKAQVARAKAGVRLGESSKLELRRREQEREARRAEIARARAQIAIVRSQLDDTVAASPIDGVVLVKSAEPGEVLSAGTTVVTIGALNQPWIRGYVGESDLGRVKLGMKVKVTTDSFPGKEYWGRVSFLSSEAEFTPKQIQTQEERVKLVYRIKIDIDNPNQELKSNMPVDAELVLDNRG